MPAHNSYAQDLISGQIGGGSIPLKHRTDKYWDINNKYTIGKKEAIDSFDWFINQWNEQGWEISPEDYSNMKKMWLLAGSPFLSHIDPYTNEEASGIHYITTSRKIDPKSRIVSDNKDYYVGSPDVLVMPNPQFGGDASLSVGDIYQGPFALLDELGHAIQFSYPKGIKGKNITGKDDLATFVASDEFVELLRSKEIATDIHGNQFLINTSGHGKNAGYSEELTDSTLFIMSQQMKGDPYLDTGIVNIFDNDQYYNDLGHFDLRYALSSHASGQWLTGEAQAHNMYSPALHLALADLSTSGGVGDGELSVSDLHSLRKTQFGKKLTEQLIYQYGVGQDDINYGSLAGINKEEGIYQASSTDPTLVQYNERITTEDDRYKIARTNIDNYTTRLAKQYKNTMKNLSDFRKVYPSQQLEEYLKQGDK